MNRSLLRISKLVGVNLRAEKQFSCWTAAITKKHREIYEKTYPAVLVMPNGSTLNIQYFEPRKIITLPLDINTLSEAERKSILDSRKPKSKVTVVEDFEDDFDESRYLKYAKR